MKRALLKNLEHSQENTCVGVAFCLSFRPATFSKKDPGTAVFL